MISEAALGDAYGAGYEFVDQEVIARENTLKEYRQHQKHSTIKPGMYTDDTHRLIALGELMVETSPDAVWTSDQVIQKMIDVFRRDPRTGYSSRMWNVLTGSVLTAKEKEISYFKDNLVATSEQSGAAMGASILGLHPSLEVVFDRATVQAMTTHNSDAGIASAKAAAYIVHYFYHLRGQKSLLGLHLNSRVPFRDHSYEVPLKGPTTTLGIECVQAAVDAISTSRTLSEVLHKSIAVGGDVDTVAAIAMAGASVCREIIWDIPWSLQKGLEDGQFGRGYLDELNAQLLAKFPPSK